MYNSTSGGSWRYALLHVVFQRLKPPSLTCPPPGFQNALYFNQ